MEMYAYDTEIFRNYALFVFYDVSNYVRLRQEYDDNGINNVELFKKTIFSCKRYVFNIGLGWNDIARLVSFVNRDIILVSFNGLDYDNILINACIAKINHWRSVAYTNEQLYKLSKRIISNQMNDIYNDDYVTTYKYMNTLYKSIDVQKVFGLNKVKKSLKQTLINLKWYNIEDYEMQPISALDQHLYSPNEIAGIEVWDRFMMPEFLEGVFYYCCNDTLGVCEVVYQKMDDIKLRFNISIRYGVDVLSSSESNIADKIFGKKYCDIAGIDYSTYMKGRTFRQFVDIGECINPVIHFKTDELSNLLEKLKRTRIYNTKGDIEIFVTFAGTEYKIAAGGLHSVDGPAKFAADDENDLRDADVTSYYPNIVINGEISPAHLNAKYFIKTTEGVVKDRIAAKHRGDKVEANTLKITINSGVFGKMGFPDSPVHDIKALVSVTINGQLFLMMLIESLVTNGIRVISANTDGIVSIVPKDKSDLYYKLCEEWSKIVNFELEFTHYELYIRRDVNNYMAVKTGTDPVSERIKYKGALNPNLFKEDLRKSYKYPIVAKAISAYYLSGKSIMDTISECTDIMEFCSTQKSGANFKLELLVASNGKVFEKPLSKNIRYYVSKRSDTNTGVLRKNDVTQKLVSAKYTRIHAGKTVTIFNKKVDFDSISDYKIDYGFYYSEAKKIIQAIESNSNIKKVIKNNYGQLNLGF